MIVPFDVFEGLGFCRSAALEFWDERDRVLCVEQDVFSHRYAEAVLRDRWLQCPLQRPSTVRGCGQCRCRSPPLDPASLGRRSETKSFTMQPSGAKRLIGLVVRDKAVIVHSSGQVSNVPLLWLPIIEGSPCRCELGLNDTSGLFGVGVWRGHGPNTAGSRTDDAFLARFERCELGSGLEYTRMRTKWSDEIEDILS